MTTKSDRIRALYAEGKSVSEIAEIVGCLPEYVRVVKQRANGRSKADRKDVGAVMSRGNRDAARLSGRVAYRQARDAGSPVRTACTESHKAYMKTLRRTGKAETIEAAE